MWSFAMNSEWREIDKKNPKHSACISNGAQCGTQTHYPKLEPHVLYFKDSWAPFLLNLMCIENLIVRLVIKMVGGAIRGPERKIYIDTWITKEQRILGPKFFFEVFRTVVGYVFRLFVVAAKAL